MARYVRAFAPERIVLFGSYAKGTNRPRSDVDLLVIADLEDDAGLRLRRAHYLAADSYPPVDVVFATPDEVARASDLRNPFLYSIVRSGVTVYPQVEDR